MEVRDSHLLKSRQRRWQVALEKGSAGEASSYNRGIDATVRLGLEALEDEPDAKLLLQMLSVCPPDRVSFCFQAS